MTQDQIETILNAAAFLIQNRGEFGEPLPPGRYRERCAVDEIDAPSLVAKIAQIMAEPVARKTDRIYRKRNDDRRSK